MSDETARFGPADKVSEAAAAAAEWSLVLSEDRLTEAEFAALRGWCEASPENQRELMKAMAVWRAFDGVSNAPDFIQLKSESLNDFRAAQFRLRRGRPGISRRWLVGLAASVVAGVGGYYILAGGETSTTYVTAPPERRVVALEDGSRLSLDGDTQVRVRFDRNKRSIWLDRGRARFAVAKDPMKPFTVSTGRRVVVATGTDFTVEILADRLRVVLFEGRIAVLNAYANGDTEAVVVNGMSAEQALSPGHELVVWNSNSATIARADLSVERSWEAGQLVFERESLALAVARVNRYADTKIVISESVPSALAVSGVYKSGDVVSFLNGVTALHPLQYRRQGAGFLLESRAPVKK